MDDTQTQIKLDVDTWKIKVRTRRNNRMRLQINLSKDEAIAFKNFSDICKPNEVPEADFLKTIFVTGIEAMNKQLAELVQKYATENKEELAASGITVLEGEDGEVKLASTADLISPDIDVSGPVSYIPGDESKTAQVFSPEDAAPQKYEPEN
tara:strand:- start:515 stop:970 length:456 start_codon:yes stop_codon:yes gene_type:complete